MKIINKKTAQSLTNNNIDDTIDMLKSTLSMTSLQQWNELALTHTGGKVLYKQHGCIQQFGTYGY